MDLAIKKIADAPAFARAETDDNYGSEGIDTRTYIATKAMAAMINAEWCIPAGRLDPNDTAKEACKFADALISEISKS